MNDDVAWLAHHFALIIKDQLALIRLSGLQILYVV